MPSALITVVLPAYDQQEHLKDCLDSLLAQSFRDFEIVLVVDRSPECPERLAEAYEMRDPRVNVLRLNAAVGIGRSRDAGAAKATGEYLLFLDSDHLLDPDALQAIADRLAETGPVDVLLFGHNREYRGRSWPGAAAELLAAAGPEVLGPLARPELLGAPPMVWDRLLRRDIVPPFPEGHYEEVPVAHHALLTAERVAVLDRECVQIRRRHTLHPTGSPGSSHFDIFEQYQRSFELVADRPELAPALPFLFTRMIRHYLFVFDLAGCVPRSQRPQFFQRAAEHYRTYLPEDYKRPDGREGIKFSLLASGAYAAFELAKLSHIARSAVGRRA
ncbi:glycosyltransferase family A protein [Kitasatospora sp. MAP5-34]|uniref:glycosyltransferase family 2 protein n=1 Tax=Kitasatospora sp. MAP5-34 TaxID=3035102 RepID=UPI0024747A57|nr:glycosyltransferase family A protein [Kitasatospora sp. MAP5-34]MDH6577841.1 glycosyltransferase involved in cell wall biosynthesis [Kitasatospora sp. MAP5-34]